MATSSMNGVLRHLRRVALRHDGGGLTDGQLLERFLAMREEAAFEALVRRHGPMVLGVCRRVLEHTHDAEDAFQATFLVFARKAESIVARDTVGNWLYGVAYRTAQKERAAATRRRVKERHMSRPEALDEDVWRELRPLLDQELNRLPEKYREPVILCDLEGQTRKEAARRLGWPEGTLSGRLSRARVLLAKRLARHGLTLSGGAVAVALSQNAASAGVPASLLGSTVQAATLVAAGHTAAGVVSTSVAVLTEGVLKAMFMTKLRIAATMVVAASLFSVGWGAYEMQVAEPPGPAKEVVEKRAAGKTGEKSLAPGEKPGLLPSGPAPIQVLLSLTKDGKIRVQRGVLVYKPVAEVDSATGAKMVRYECSSVSELIEFDGDGVQAFDTKGKKIELSELPKMLAEQVPALASADGKEVDPLHLRLIKEGTLVLVLSIDWPLVTPPPTVPFVPTAPPGAVPAIPAALPAPPGIAPPILPPAAVPVAPALPGGPGTPAPPVAPGVTPPAPQPALPGTPGVAPPPVVVPATPALTPKPVPPGKS
jgi:RNA polymerase sigma factor (sigma-70 family)